MKFNFLGYVISIEKKRPQKDVFKPLKATKTRKVEIDINDIMELKKQGFSNVKIAKKFGVSEATIRRRIKENNQNEKARRTAQ